MALLMYLDRACLGSIISSDSFKRMLSLEKWQKEWVVAAFFWAYALAQMPAGWLSDRYGARALMSIYIALWSLFTLGTGFANGFLMLLLMRLGCGLAEAGAFPTSSGILMKWAHIDWRALGSGIVTLGGRTGGAIAAWLTGVIILGMGDWRWAGWIFGAAGLFVALAFWVVYREHPRRHPGCNAAEIALLGEGRGDFVDNREPPRAFPWAAALRHRTLWIINLYQFLANMSWVFLLNTLPDFLKEGRHFDDPTKDRVQTYALLFGLAALPLAGALSDMCRRRFGPVWGRRLPLCLTRFGAAAAFLSAMHLHTPTGLIIAFGMIAFCADFALPATWTTIQDISGRHQGQIFGWSNMWGNFGAASQALIMGWVLARFDWDHSYNAGLIFSASVMALCGLVALIVDPRDVVMTADGHRD
jgi:MFS family permease